ncbi:hypothetical protein ABLU29_09750 [Lactococcus lactis]
MEINYCSICGKKVAKDEKNCERCGYDLEARRILAEQEKLKEQLDETKRD